jgi:transcription initiation factor TFIID subunit 5
MQNDLLLIAAIINDKILFKNSENLVNSSYIDHPIELQGYIPTPTIKLQVDNEANLTNLPSISLGVPGKGIISNDIKMPDTRYDQLYREWLKHLVRPKLLLSSNHTQNETEENKIIGNSLEPSILFATLTNTSDGMICMNINKSVTQAVAGFRDSSVRVWNLNEKEKNENLGDFSMSEVLPKTKSNFKSSNNLISSSSKVSSMQSAESKSSYPMLQLRGHSKAVYGVSQDNTNRLVISSSADETIRLWDTNVGQIVGKYSCVGPAWDVDFGPLGYYFASANQDRTVSIYSTDRSAPIRLMTGHVSDATCVRWHDNCSLLASGSDDKTARLWDIRSGECARLFKGSNAPLSCIACSHDGRLVAAGTDNGMLHLWDINTGRQMAIFQGHTTGQAIHSLAFSADSIGLSSGSADCSVRVWDIASICSQPPMIAGLGGSGLSQVSCHKVFYTKFTSTYFVDYTDKNLLIAGGPFSLSSIQATQVNSNHQQSIKTDNNSGQALSVLSISHAIHSNI